MALIAQYLFNDNANDETGTYNGTATDVTYEACPPSYNFGGKVAVFNGTSSQIHCTVPTSVCGKNARSIEFWVQTTATQKQSFMSLGNGWNTYAIEQYNQYLAILGWGSRPRFGTQNMLCDGEWHHIAVTNVANAPSSSCLCYCDGVNIARQDSASSDPINASTTHFTIGLNQYYAETKADFCDCKMANFRVYDSVITAAEVASHFASENQAQLTDRHFLGRRFRDSGYTTSLWTGL